jgi:ABC-2 type transport system ATP-binding protein
MPVPAVQLKCLTKRYADVIVVDKLNLEIPRGTIFGFFGPNGAGKSTTVRMMAGLTKPDGGDAVLMGCSVRQDSLSVKRVIGVVPDSLALFEYLTVGEHLDLVRSLYEIDDTVFRNRCEQLLELLGLSADAGQLARHCSVGMRKKTALAMALLPNPKILILDEPFEGLDPIMCVTVKRALRRAAKKGMTVFLTTHLLHMVDDLVEQFGMIRDGSLVAEGDTEKLAQQGQTIEDVYLENFSVPESAGLEWLG